LSDIILTSPILYDPERPTAEGGAEGMEDGIDPNMDPELAMVREIESLRTHRHNTIPCLFACFLYTFASLFPLVRCPVLSLPSPSWHPRHGLR
jgi:hypothetical protein